ncbi:MAG: hypothetical protein AAF798_12485 [Bacteroidota bacterium]
MKSTLLKTILLACLWCASFGWAFAQDLSLTFETPAPICVSDIGSCEGSLDLPLFVSDACNPEALQFSFTFDAFSDQSILEMCLMSSAACPPEAAKRAIH